ncbi:MAG: hypothetical protein R3F43_24455 [bacterium]
MLAAPARGLEAEGGSAPSPAAGRSWVDALPDVAPVRLGPPGPAASGPGYALPAMLPDLAWSAARPRRPAAPGRPARSVALAPAEALVRAWRRALRRGPAVLGYGDPRGVPALREGWQSCSGPCRASRSVPRTSW